MEYIKNTLDFHIEQPTVITLGKFDGLHRGHERLMETIMEEGNLNGYKTVVFTFDIPPKKQIYDSSNQVITTNDEKYYIFSSTGVDYLIECPFTKEVMTMEPIAFIEWIVQALNVKCFVLGEDFHFGYKRLGDYQLLKEYENKFGYKTIVLKKVQEDGRDISSSFVREELVKGNIKKVNHLLGYEYFVQSEVIHGQKLGRTIGIPTINMILPNEKLLPPNGVYVSRVLVGEEWYMGVTNIGRKPTVGENNPVGVETYIIDFCQNVYGSIVTVHLLDFIRPEKKFASIDDLKYQMNCDIMATKKYYGNVTEIC